MAKSQDEICNKVLHLTSWPPLEQFLQETAQPIARICALLARRPSVGMFIPVILDMPSEIIYPLLQMLYEKGHIRQEVVSRANESHAAATVPREETETAKSARSPAATETLSFFELLWRRLTETEKPNIAKFV